MRRLLPCLLVFAGFGCNCDPPGVGTDAGAGDGGVGADGGGGVGLGDGGTGDFQLSGELWWQRDDGMVAHMDMATGTVTRPFGDTSAVGAITELNDQVLFFTPTEGEGNNFGRLATWDAATGAHDKRALYRYVPYQIETDGVSALMVDDQIDGLVRVSGLTYAESAVVVNNSAGGTSVAFDSTSGVVSGSAGTARLDGTALFGAHCGGLARNAADDGWLCAYVDGSTIEELPDSGGVTELDSTSGDRFLSVTHIDGSYVGVRSSCSVQTPLTRFDDVAELCPVNLVEVDGRVFAGLREGGVVEVATDGALTVRLTGAIVAGGLGAANGSIVVGGSFVDDVALLMTSDGVAPRQVRGFEGSLALVLTDDGDVFALTEEGVAFEPATDDGVLEHIVEQFDLDHLVAAGADLFFASADGVQRFAAASAPNVTPTSVRTLPVTLLGACGDVAVFYDDTDDEVLTLAADGTETVELSDVTATVGSPVAVGCVNGQLVIANDDDELWARPLGDTRAIRHFGDSTGPVVHLVDPGNG